MCLWVVTAAVLLPPLIMGIFAVLQKIKRDKDIDMKDEDFIVEISDSIISMGVMIDLVSAGIMVGFTIFTENLPPLIFYAVFGLLFWIGSFLIYRTLSFKVIVKDKKIAVYSSFGKTYYLSFSDLDSAARQYKPGKTGYEKIRVKTASGKSFTVRSREICYKYFKERIKSEIPKENLIGFGGDSLKK